MSRPIQIALELIANIALPYLIYTWAKPSLGDVHALLASSLPPIVWSLVEFARTRKIDALSTLVLAGIALSLLAFAGGGSVRVLQLRENLVTGLVGLVFLVSVVLRRPLVLELACAAGLRASPENAAQFVALRTNAPMRRRMNVITLVWGFGLLAQTAAACALVVRLPIDRYLVASPILGYGSTALLVLWTWRYAKVP